MARPDLSYLKNVILACAGIAAGLWCGATGIAPAPVLAPLLAWLLGMGAQRIGASVLFVTLSASLLSLIAYQQAHQLSVVLVAAVFVTIVVGSLFGSVPQLSMMRSASATQIILAVAIAVVGVGMCLPEARPYFVFKYLTGVHPALVPAMLGGLTAGFVAALAGASGVLIVPALCAFAQMPILLAQGTALASLALVSAAPALRSAAQRSLPDAALWCGAGAALGALVGSRIAVHLNGVMLTINYGVSLILAALMIVVGSRVVPSGRAPAGGGDGAPTAAR